MFYKIHVYYVCRENHRVDKTRDKWSSFRMDLTSRIGFRLLFALASIVFHARQCSCVCEFPTDFQIIYVRAYRNQESRLKPNAQLLVLQKLSLVQVLVITGSWRKTCIRFFNHSVDVLVYSFSNNSIESHLQRSCASVFCARYVFVRVPDTSFDNSYLLAVELLSMNGFFFFRFGQKRRFFLKNHTKSL